MNIFSLFPFYTKLSKKVRQGESKYENLAIEGGRPQPAEQSKNEHPHPARDSPAYRVGYVSAGQRHRRAVGLESYKVAARTHTQLTGGCQEEQQPGKQQEVKPVFFIRCSFLLCECI